MISRRKVLAIFSSVLPLSLLPKSKAATKTLLCSSKDVPMNKSVVFQGEDPSGNQTEVGITRTKKGLFAFNAICTHTGCGTQPQGRNFFCQCHSSLFDGTTGKRLKGPAQRPLMKYKVVEEKGNIYIFN